jgi:hypothetical protein
MGESMTVSTERITLQKFAASVHLAAEQTQEFLSTTDAVMALVTAACHGPRGESLPDVQADGRGGTYRERMVRLVLAMADPDHPAWHDE